MCKTYNCGPFNCIPTNNWYYEVEAVVTDVLTDGSTILGECKNELPHQSLMSTLFNGSVLKQLSIPGTLLSDDDLDPGEYITLEQIFNYYDVCNSDFEIGVPVGAMAALACGALDIPVAGATCRAFTSGFEISLSVDGGSIMVTSNLVSHGYVSDILGDYNVPESVYVALSKLGIKWIYCSGVCGVLHSYYNVTVETYFRCK